MAAISGPIPKLATETDIQHIPDRSDFMRLKLTLDFSGLVSVLCPRIGISSCVWVGFTFYFQLFFFSFLPICWQRGVMDAFANAVQSPHTGHGFGSDRSIPMQQYETSCSQDAGQIYMTPWPEVAGSVWTGSGASWIASPPQPRFPAPRQLSQCSN
ncbi:hypothetical protein BDW42DRAFT_72986 [Aspergillus taichungensis]|uniref:Uncharacterized protein n=1 Tax=Aspergillus taichungensis TaxID=482145 RepID=A0A2J5HZH2_9EURO|nr:hypothetical protein BDW42DRAFT_72986 [Aspergillus taichungensis]